VRIAIEYQAARIGALLLFERIPGWRFRFGRAGGFLRDHELCGGGFAVDEHEIVAR
jgi:hypothetical protein